MFQQTIIIGHVDRAPDEIRYTNTSETAVCNFDVSTNDRDKLVRFRISAWDRLADFCFENIQEDMLVMVRGSLHADENGNPRRWTGQAGQEYVSFELNARLVKFLGWANPAENDMSF